jgi:hypothetical protein
MVAFNDDQARATSRPLPQPLHLANEGLAFLLELAMIAGLAWWGSQAVSGLAGRVALAILTPVAAVIVWALLAAPKARIRLPLPGVLAVKAVVFAGAAVAVYSIGQHALAIVFAVVTAVNTAVAAVDRQALMATRAGLPDPPEELPQVGDEQVRGMDTAHQWPKRYGGHDILTPRGEYAARPGRPGARCNQVATGRHTQEQRYRAQMGESA